MPDPLPQSILCPVLIGRDAQVAALARLLEQARSGHGQIALICGEAGIGKSRLITEAKQRAAAQGFTIRQTACFEQERALPYAPLLDLVRMAQPATPLSPELAALIAGQRANPHADGEQVKRRLLEALAGFLLPLTPSDPAKPALIVPRLLVFDDLHWCDEATLEFLHFLLRKLAPLPAILLVAFRHDEITPGLGRWLTAVARTRAVTEIKLTPLTKLEIGAMVRAIFQLPRTSQSDFVEALHS
jgi:predicted ATPase